MGLHPKPVTQRAASNFRDMWARIRRLEARTAGIDSGFPLMALPAQIDPAYTSGDPKVLINGASTLSGPFQHLASYTPAAGDQVIIQPVVCLRTYVILGKLA